MYLKRLEIKGFKTFADYTEINLNPGINIIVGPNGCGKSNIIDAVRWVLGEANIRSLRGYRNDDVIFNGTDKKKALGMAEVVMTVDNSEGLLPLEYNEVTVSRKVFRSGESEFSLNKIRVRMKDIVKIYTDTGLGRKGYSIISQGELERVLNGQPFDRRLMLEEAAGTMRYRQQRDEVLQRILATTQDLLRVEDIMKELENRKLELYNKAEKARIYLAVREEYDLLDKQVVAFQIKELTETLGKKESELTGLRAEQKDVTDGLEQAQAKLQEAENAITAEREKLNRLNEDRYGLETGLNRINSDLKLSQERIKNYRERIATAEADGKKYALSLEKLEQDIQSKIADFDQDKVHYQERKLKVDTLARDIMNIDKKMDEQTFSLDKKNQLLFERVKREAEIKNMFTDCEDRIRKAQEKKERLNIRLQESREQLLSSAGNLKELGQSAAGYARQLDKWEKMVHDAEQEKNEYLQLRNDIDREHHDISQERINLEHKLLVLQDLQKNFAGYSDGVKILLRSWERGEPRVAGIIGMAADLLQVPADVETAIEVALGKKIEHVVVKTADSARKAIEFLKQQRGGRVTFLPLDTMRVRPVPDQTRNELMDMDGVLGLAVDIVKFDPEYEKAFMYLLGRVLVVRDLNCGMKVWGRIKYPMQIVTLEGDIINTGGAMTGGTLKQTQTSPLHRNREVKQISQRLAKIRQAEFDNRAQGDDLANKLKLAEDRLQEARNSKTEAEIQLKIIKDEKLRVEAMIKTFNHDKDSYMQEISQLEDNIERAQAELQKWQDSYQGIKETNQLAADEISRLRLEADKKRREYEVKKERLLSYREQLEMKSKELENNQKNIDQFDQVKISYRQSVMETRALIERLERDINVHQERIAAGDGRKKSQERELVNISGLIDAARQEEKELGRTIEKIKAGIASLQQQITARQDQMRALELKAVRFDTELEGLYNQWREKYETEPYLSYDTELTPRQVREYRLRIDGLHEQIESLGSIDIDSIKEYDDIKVRYDFLVQQTGDLSAARDSLQELLQETEQIMADNFARFMILANESFSRTFVEIFEGGEASLNIESVDDLAAGVDIMVKMPGKRRQSLNLLSGGERALTCIAFIFSLLRLKPAPFCLLDEIDASLDETNLSRFADFLRAMAADTQFIVITHRQATIEAGNNIYGITMPQEGVSSILSLDSDNIQTLAG